MPPLIPDSLPPDISLNGGLPTIPPAPLLDPTRPTNSVPPFIYPLIFPAGNNGATPPTPPTPIPEPSTLLLVLRPHERVGCVAKLFARGFSVELPVDCDANAVDPAIPRATLAAERRQIRNSSLAEALP